jgi:hypothetical protein
MSIGWRHADFAARVGDQIILRAVDGPGAGQGVLATLSGCSEAVCSGGFVSYHVTFLAGSTAPREQAVFLLEASGRDPEPVFLVPVREVGDRLEYEAVFNQSVENGSGS